nr:MAG TPA: hypothetical protein [Caudoviricetes sp.]
MMIWRFVKSALLKHIKHVSDVVSAGDWGIFNAGTV